MLNKKLSHWVMALVLPLSVGCGGKSSNDLATRTFFLQGPAGRLFVDQGGSGGTPVIIVHSLAGNTTQWQPQILHLRQHRPVVAFDMRGHGQSDPAPNDDYSLAAMAGDVAAIVDSLALPRVILVGHSYGGGVIAAYAGAHPGKVAGLLFVDAIGDSRNAPPDQIKQFLDALHSEAYSQMVEAHWRSILENADSTVSSAVLTGLHNTPKVAVLNALEAIFTYDPAGTLATYQGPMHAIVSGLPDDPGALHHAVPRCTQVTMPNTSHWLQMDQPEQFNKLMDEFLQSVDAGG